IVVSITVGSSLSMVLSDKRIPPGCGVVLLFVRRWAVRRPDRADQVETARGRGRAHRQAVPDGVVAIELTARVQKPGAAGVLEMHHVAEFGCGETQYGEGHRTDRWACDAIGYHLHGDVRPGREVGQVIQLCSPDLVSADRAPQRGLLDHEPHLRWL